MRRATAIVLIVAGVAAALVMLAGVTFYVLARQAEPSYSGDVAVSGISAPVTVTFGPRAVPYIQAASLQDALFAQGYVTASERMWQMDILRRAASGSLAEVFGDKALTVDRLFRILGLRRAAKLSLEIADPVVIGLAEAYARGVNAYIEHRGSRLPLEYRIAGFRPRPWDPVDSLVIGEFMAYRLSFNFREELLFLRLAARVERERLLELFPVDEGIPAPADGRELPDFRDVFDEAARVLPGPVAAVLRPGPASNNWVVAGDRTRDGLPLLANDPHLAATVPGIWYELELQAPGLHVAGLSLPGIPFVVIGHNENLAWGLTTTTADTQDLFVERATANGTHVERAGGRPEPVSEIVEEIRVKSRPEPERQLVRMTSNGVILNDVLGPGSILGGPTPNPPYLLALRWNLQDPERSLDALYALNTARTVAEARDAIDGFDHVSQNFVYAHADGTIGWRMSGALPARKRGSGAFPAPGWTGEYGWTGYRPSRENPGVENPPQGFIVTANSRTVSPDAPVQPSHSWMAPYRTLRIAGMLEEAERLSPGDMVRMQTDVRGIEAQRVQDALRRMKPELSRTDPAAWAIAQQMILEWDGEFAPDSASAAYYVLLRRALYRSLFGDELGDDLPDLANLYSESYGPLQEAVRTGRSAFWRDDTTTPPVETEAGVWARALHRAYDELADMQGDPTWSRLDRLRRLTFRHAFHDVPILGRLFDVGPLGMGGDSFTVNVTKAPVMTPESAEFVASYRVVFTPGDWAQTRGTNTLGQSGHRFSPHRTDQLDDWLAGRTHPWFWGGPPEDQVIGVLILRPED